MGFPFSSLYIMFLFVDLLISLQQYSSISIGSPDLIHQSCKKVAKSDPNLSYNFCVTTLEANPKSENATSIEELALVSIELTISNATKVRSNISHLLKQNKFTMNPNAENCLKDCLRFYSDAISSLRYAKCDFRSKNFARANLEISSAMDAPSTCEMEGGFARWKAGFLLLWPWRIMASFNGLWFLLLLRTCWHIDNLHNQV